MPALTWGRSLLVFGILTGLASANAQVAAQGEVPDFSSNLAGWVNIDMDFLPVPGAIDPTLKAEVRRRWEAGEPVGLISELVEDKPWHVREFSIRDLDNNQLRFGRPSS